jgi:arginyl-tRNA synthetase
MSTLTIESLEFLLGSLGVETPFPSHASSAILDRPLDIPRAYLAKALQELVPDHAANAHSAIIAATSIDAGDLCVVLRRLDHTCDAEELAFDLMARVSRPMHCTTL